MTFDYPCWAAALAYLADGNQDRNISDREFESIMDRVDENQDDVVTRRELYDYFKSQEAYWKNQMEKGTLHERFPDHYSQFFEDYKKGYAFIGRLCTSYSQDGDLDDDFWNLKINKVGQDQVRDFMQKAADNEYKYTE